MEYIRSNLTEVELCETFVGMHTVGGALEKLICSYQDLSRQVADNNTVLHHVLDLVEHSNSFRSVAATDSTPSLSSLLLAIQLVVNRSLPRAPRNAVAPSTAQPMSRVLVWPSTLTSLRKKRLSDVNFRFHPEELYRITPSRSNRSQSLVLQAIKIVEEESGQAVQTTVSGYLECVPWLLLLSRQ